MMDTSGAVVVLCMVIGGMGVIIVGGIAAMIFAIRRRSGPTRE